MKLAIFYHFYLPRDYTRCMLAPFWIDEQIGLIKSSRLHESSTVYMHITMPLDLPYDQHSNMHDRIISYIKTRYPFVNILGTRSLTDENLYEGSTLYELYQYARNNDGAVLYIHNKGIVNTRFETLCWSQLLNHFMITEWQKCVDSLEKFDIACVADRHVIDSGHVLTSGNFWWATCDYIKGLPNPLHVEKYNNVNRGRHAYELWVRLNNPSTWYTVSTNTEHYDDLLYVEDVIEALTQIK